jgi:hypothetical protein
VTAAEIYQHAQMFFPPPPAPAMRADEMRNAPESSGVYFCYHGQFVVYVGESMNIKARFSGHEHLGRFDSVGFLLCDPHQRKRLEAFYKGLLDPPLNHESSERLLLRCRSGSGLAKKVNFQSGLIRAFIGLLCEKGRATKTEVYRAVKRGWKNSAREFDEVVSFLVRWGAISVSKVETKGRPQTYYEMAAVREEVAKCRT